MLSQVDVSQLMFSPRVTRLVLPEDNILAEVDELFLTGTAILGFQTRNSTQFPNIVHVGIVTSSQTSAVIVDTGVELSVLTQSTIRSNIAVLNNTIIVVAGGNVDLPEMVVIENGTSLELCGGLSSRTRVIDIQEGGIFKTAFPAYSGSRGSTSIQGMLTLFSLQSRRGGLIKSSRCGSNGNLFLQLTQLNTTEDFVVPDGISISSTENATWIERSRAPLPNKTCILNSYMHLYKGQECELPAGEHVFSDVTLETGSKLFLQGDSTGNLKTLIHANSFYVKRGAAILGVGTGFENGGPGKAVSASIGASHGGSGAGNLLGNYPVFGSMNSPRDYGSSGYQATRTNGRGGGQLELDISSRVQIDGIVDVSGDRG